MGLEDKWQIVECRAQIEDSSWKNVESGVQMGLEGRWQMVDGRLKRVACREQLVECRAQMDLKGRWQIRVQIEESSWQNVESRLQMVEEGKLNTELYIKKIITIL